MTDDRTLGLIKLKEDREDLEVRVNFSSQKHEKRTTKSESLLAMFWGTHEHCCCEAKFNMREISGCLCTWLVPHVDNCTNIRKMRSLREHERFAFVCAAWVIFHLRTARTTAQQVDSVAPRKDKGPIRLGGKGDRLPRKSPARTSKGTGSRKIAIGLTSGRAGKRCCTMATDKLPPPV